MSTRFINLTKQQFGHWRVLAIHPERDHRGHILWRCVCVRAARNASCAGTAYVKADQKTADAFDERN